MTIKTRLARLEARAPGRQKVYVWKNDGETPDEAVARIFSDGAPRDTEVIMLVWATEPA